MSFMMKLSILTCFLILTASGTPLMAQSNNNFNNSIPPTYSSISFSPALNIKSGAETVIGINHVIQLADDKVIGIKWFSEKKPLGNIVVKYE